MSDDHSSWDVINSDDLVSVDIDDSRNSLESENYIVVNQEDIIDGMACFMAKYVSSLPQAKVSNLFDIYYKLLIFREKQENSEFICSC
mgnify:FL=1